MEEKNFSLHADPDAWKCQYICDDCINKLPDCRTCDICDEEEQLEAMSKNECEYHYKKQSTD